MFRGSLVALTTPMHRDGTVDEAAFAGFVDWQIEQGTQGIVPVGTPVKVGGTESCGMPTSKLFSSVP